MSAVDPQVLLEKAAAVFADLDTTRDDECVSIAIGASIALELEIAEEPMMPTHFVLLYRQWDRTHGLAVDDWVCSWPAEAIDNGSLRAYIVWRIEAYNKEQEY